MMELIEPNWPAPPWVRAYATTRSGGVSRGAYASLNLGDHVGDQPDRVERNRQLLRERLALPAEPAWLCQVHGCHLVADRFQVHNDGLGPTVEADGMTAHGPGTVCVVMTADCLPVLMCDRRGTRVAAVHAGWRGLAAGILEQACAAMERSAGELLIWLGPAIGAQAFEVGDEVRERFIGPDPVTRAAFLPTARGTWLADLAGLARRRLARLGVTEVHGGEYCTLSEPERFFSYRRDGVTGRMASLIWLDPAPPDDCEDGDADHG
jgi:hypothetical protein